jgi:hypothetical protein
MASRADRFPFSPVRWSADLLGADIRPTTGSTSIN